MPPRAHYKIWKNSKFSAFSFSKKLEGRQLMAEREKSAFSRSLSVLRFLPADSKLFENQNSQSAWY
jgi:hypothetical protein